MSSVAASVVFRTDASWIIGNGHVMRCMTLADRLRDAGWQTLFLCRAHDGHLGDRIEARGHELFLLDPAPPVPGDTAHATWLGGTWEDDAAQTRDALRGRQFDWLVVDHYALDASWERSVRPDGARVMAIDDLADRPHEVDLMFDQNLGRRDADYNDLVPRGTARLIGPRFALLRPEFALARPAALARRAARDWAVSSVLVAMGGTDPTNATGEILTTLARAGVMGRAQVRVVLGSNAPHLGAVQDQVARLGEGVDLLVDRSDMADLMSEADLAIGGIGGTSWERCSLGLPALLLVLADNQRPAAEALDRTGAAILCGDVRHAGWQDKLADVVAGCQAPARLKAVSQAAASVCDGLGTALVAQLMREKADAV